MKALVTGAAGFLGSHIVDACLAAGDEVRVLVRPTSDLSYLRTVPNVEFVYGDLTDEGSLRAATHGVDVVYHSAARATDRGSRAEFWADNVTSTERLLRVARQDGVERFVFVSSPSALMNDGDQLGIDESQPYPERFLNSYCETKAVAEQAVLAADGIGFTTCAIRPRAVWGPRDRRGWLPKLLGRMHTGSLPDLSGGKTVYASLCHCEHAARACVQAARSERVGGKAYFVADRETTDLWGFLRQLAELFSVRPPTKRIPPLVRDALVEAVELVWRLPFVANRYSPPLSRYSVALVTRSATYDTSAAERDFDYTPMVSQEVGLQRLVAWVAVTGGVEQFVRHGRR